jgi:superfamily II DNA or RNA helicase
MNTKNYRFREYQGEADKAIYDELLVNNKCIVKMFCGTGKSLLMRYCKVSQNKNLVCYVVPSLALLEQFYEDYFEEKKDYPLENILRISSEKGSTTETEEIVNFLKKDTNKIICVTYQSLDTFISALGNIKIDVCIFDEAHHSVGKTYKSLIFETNVCEKQIFFTATPKNANGVIMYDKDNLDLSICGKLVYDYSYFKGVMEGYLNPFEIRLDFYTENTNTSVYESIARAILESGNSRVLTFHSDVNGDRDASVLQFVNNSAFQDSFNKVLGTEFPEKIGFYKNIIIISLHSDITMKQRKHILKKFDETPENNVFIISSCQTIGEGIDTKNANMCVFVDPKTSIVGITQNIGRIVRKNPDVIKPNSTILIPCWVDKEKYLDCNGDRDKCDEVIREDMNKEGKFNGILNVMSALKQEDEDLFDVCLNYPSTYSPQEIEGNLSKYGYKLEEPIGDGSLVENLEHVLETTIDLDEDNEETDEEMMSRVANENNIVIEVHSNSLETPIEYYGEQEEGKEKEVVRVFKSYDEEMEENIYQPIVKKDGSKRNAETLEPLRRDNRFNVKVHTNPDVKVLWSLSSDLDLSRDICSCVIDCEVVDMWPQKFEELKTFIDINERRPLINVKFPSEKKMSQWLVDQNKYYKKKTHGMKVETRYNLWTQFLEEYEKYFISNNDLYSKRIEELRLFINKKSSLPSTVSHIKEEKILGKWVGDQQQTYKNKTAGMKDNIRYNLWTQILEDYKEYFDKWGEQINKLKLFIQINKKTPSSSSKNICEQLLGRWTRNQKKNYKNKTEGMKDEERYNLWTQFLEEYKEYFISDEDIWIQLFEELKMFIDINKRKPYINSKNLEEKQLGGWISTQQKNYKNKTDGMKNIVRYNLWTQFLEDYTKYFITIDDLWLKNLDSCKSFIQINEKIPYQTAKNSNEKYLGRWISTQQKDYKKKDHGMKEQLRYNEWTQFLEEYKEYFISWDKQLQELKLFIQINKKMPSQSSKDLNEKKISKWLSMQQHTYKNKLHGMKDEERYNLWTQFLEEYKDYFNDNTTNTKEIEEEIIVKPKQKKSAKLPKLTTPKEIKVETKEEIYVRTKPQITQFHNKFCKMRSDNLAHYFQQCPEDFKEYHRVRDECFQTFEAEDIPCYRIIKELDKIKKGGKHVVDMGCGTAKISEHFKNDPRFQFTNYDHVAINNTVQVCDISNMPLEDKTVDICILSLALWGSNCEEYIKEALRVLDENGILYIIDSTKRWSEEGCQYGSKLKQMLETNGFQIKEKDTQIDKWCYFKCVK